MPATVRPRPAQRHLHVSGYVDAPFGEVIDHLADETGRRALRTAIGVGLGLAEDEVVVERSPVRVFASGSAELEIRWEGEAPEGAHHEGAARLGVHQVRRGRCPITELVVRVHVDDDASTGPSARAVHRALDELVSRIES